MPCCRSSSIFAAIVGVVLTWQGLAHPCSDGSQTTCMAIQTSPGTSRLVANGESMFCTPAGEKVVCLVDHHHHGPGCAMGELSCCHDDGRRLDGDRDWDFFSCRPVSGETHASQECTDHDVKCEEWANRGLCYGFFTKYTCKKSCGGCSDETSTSNTTHTTTTAITTTITATTTTTTATATSTTVTTSTNASEARVAAEHQQIVALSASDPGPTAEPMTKGANAHKTGVLTLGARSDDNSNNDLHEKLKENERIIQEVIEDSLASPQVDVLRIDVASGRRLRDSDTHVFEVHFLARGFSSSISLANIEIKDALREAFFTAGVGVDVEFASLRWTRSDGSGDGRQDDDYTISISVILIVTFALLTLTVATVGVCAKFLMRKPVNKSAFTDMNAGEALPDEKKVADLEVDEWGERFIGNNPNATSGLAQTIGAEDWLIEEMTADIDVEKAIDSNSGPIEGKFEEKWEMRSSSTSEGGTWSHESYGEMTNQTSAGEVIGDLPTNDVGVTPHMKIEVGA